MRIEVINTGTELVLGNTLNTHGAWFGRELFKFGLRIERQTTVPDGDAIRESLAEAVSRADVVIVTGGLGPTSDDLTREITAEVLGLDLILDQAVLAGLEEFFAIRNRPMADANRKQALVPVGADVLANPNGTAPGVYVPPRLNGRGNAAVFLLPGPPRELHPMFTAEVVPRLKAISGDGLAAGCSELKFTGIGESDFHQGIDARLAEIEGLEIGYCARVGEVDLRLIGDDQAREAGRAIALAAFGGFLINEDGRSLEETVIGLFTAKGWTLAAAESCTGGLISSRLTDVAGSSAVFTHGFITYANEAKRDMLGVDEAVLERYGAVSEEVVRAMAEGALRVSGADAAVAVTGIAGPGGGTAEKPAGTVWLAWAVKDGETRAIRHYHPRSRKDFKMAVSQGALDGLRRLVLA